MKLLLGNLLSANFLSPCVWAVSEYLYLRILYQEEQKNFYILLDVKFCGKYDLCELHKPHIRFFVYDWQSRGGGERAGGGIGICVCFVSRVRCCDYLFRFLYLWCAVFSSSSIHIDSAIVFNWQNSLNKKAEIFFRFFFQCTVAARKRDPLALLFSVVVVVGGFWRFSLDLTAFCVAAIIAGLGPKNRMQIKNEKYFQACGRKRCNRKSCIPPACMCAKRERCCAVPVNMLNATRK